MPPTPAPDAPAAAAPEATFDKAFDQMAADQAPEKDPPADQPAGPSLAPSQDDPSADPPADAEADADPEAGADGEDKGADDPEKPADGEEARAEAEAAAADDEKPPEGLTEKAQERFKTILAERKELRGKAEKLERSFSELTGWIREVGATPEEFQEHVERLRMFKNPKGPDELKSLRTQLLEAVQDITVRLGDDAPGFDPLDGFDDLRKDVEDMKISPERARELAMARRKDKRGEKVGKEREERDQATQQQQAKATEIREAQTAIKALEASWKKTDPDAARKIKVILSNIEDFKYIPPRKWAETVKKRYESLSGLAPQRKPQSERPAGGGASKSPGGKAEPEGLGALMDTMVVR